MKLKITLRTAGRGDVDLIATLAATARVRDLAEFLTVADPRGRTSAAAPAHAVANAVAGPPTSTVPMTVRVLTPVATDLDPDALVADSGLSSGMTVGLAPAGALPVGGAPAGAAAVLEVIAGPDRGTELRLPRGTSLIGRDAGCAVRLTDPLVSRRHAQLTIGAHLEITDLGSANGLEIGGGAVSRALLRVGDIVRIGDTDIRVLSVNPAAGSVLGDADGFNRPPRLSPVHKGEELQAPKPPAPPKTARIPIIPLFTPLLLGGVLYLTTHSAASLVFVALSPLMGIGYTLENRVTTRKDHKAETARFRAALAGLVTATSAAIDREAAARRREHPGLADCADAIRSGGPLLWTRRPDTPGFGELRLATATLPARTSVELPDARDSEPALAAELAAALAPFAQVEAVPVVASPGEHGAIGLAGRRDSLLWTARGLVVQAVALHSPAELVLAAFASAQTAADWDWLKWLPHTTPGAAPLANVRLAATAADATTLVSDLEELVAGRAARAEADGPALPLVLAIVEDDTPVDRSRLVALAESGRRHGVFVLWLADRAARLPSACRVFATVDPAAAFVGFADSGESMPNAVFEGLDAATALELALALAPRVDSGARAADASDLPRTIALLEVGDRQLAAAPEAILERWMQNRSILTGPFAPDPDIRKQRPATLRAVIGESAAGPHALDLRADGPHALVGGTTGSGKSELLQAWILALAATHSPQRLNFLLVDYKGGSAFGGLNDLPHTVGLVTDLDQHQVRRCLDSLAAELHAREELFAQHRVKDLVEFEQRGGAQAPPSLVIVVDEFAALVKELPEFVNGVVNVAQRGRSLGVHLILATQRPNGVINDNLRANTNLRLALRMADESDSTDVLGTKEAAYFDPGLPGRAVSKTGPGRLVPFQVGYVGGWTSDEPSAPEILVRELGFGAGTRWKPDTPDVVADQGANDLLRMVHAVRTATWHAQLPPPRRPWLDPLGTLYNLADRERFPYTGTPNRLVFAVSDLPSRQTQLAVAFDPDRDGNLAVYGTGGSGKSTLLRTIAIAAGMNASVDPCHVYALDFGARGLAMLGELPHVGNVVSGSDHELVARVLAWLHDLVAKRAARYAKAEVNTITSYRTLPGATPDPRILLLVDGMAAFKQAYETSERSKQFDQFCAIASEGRPVGVHVLVTADRPGSVPSALASSMQRRVVLRLADANDYSILGVPMDVLRPAAPAGRGLMERTEIQVALLGDSAEVGVQAMYARGLARSMAKAGVASAHRIERTPEHVVFAQLPEQLAGHPVIGMRVEDLSPLSFKPSGPFLVSGAPASGRTSTLRALATALHRWDQRTRLYLFAARRSDLADLALWTEKATTVDDAAELARKLTAQGAADQAYGPVALFIESFTEFPGMPADPLTELARACVASRGLVVAETESSASGNSALSQLAKSARTGLALAPLPTDGFNLFRTQFSSRINPADFPPGRALFVAGGKTTAVQLAWTEEA